MDRRNLAPRQANAITDAAELDRCWTDIWSSRSVDEEVRTIDFWRAREYLLKYTSRFGLALDAGCGLGRYTTYLNSLGITTIGADISHQTLCCDHTWAASRGYLWELFVTADVRRLPLPDECLATYISLGVIEHFEEGPQEALAEAYRVLKPGGMAIIETPNLFDIGLRFVKTRATIRNEAKKLANMVGIRLGHPAGQEVFFQYEYSPRTLSRFVREAGFDVLVARGTDLKFSFWEVARLYPWLKHIQPWVFPLLHRLDHSPLSWFGGLSFVIGRKPRGEDRSALCFFCGKMFDGAPPEPALDVHICPTCDHTVPSDLVEEYRPGSLPASWSGYSIADDAKQEGRDEPLRQCQFCGATFRLDPDFGDFGFAADACSECTRQPLVNLRLGLKHFKQVWCDLNAGGLRPSAR